MTYDDDIDKILADQEKSRQEKQKQEEQHQPNNHVDNKNNEEEDFIDYVIKKVKKTVKCEDALIRQILYTGLSSYIGT